jgi:hypothetical protein
VEILGFVEAVETTSTGPRCNHYVHMPFADVQLLAVDGIRKLERTES